MKETSPNITYFNREMNKIRLQNFGSNHRNLLDKPIETLLGKILGEHKKCSEEFQILLDLIGNDSVQKMILRREHYEENGANLYKDFMGLHQQKMELENELIALYESKIVYAFKNVEIRIKSLLSQAYPNNKISKSYKWGNLIEFLRFKKIEPADILGYKEINELRQVNNSIKHSAEEIDNTLNHILEFKNINQISFELYEKFYERIRQFPALFIKNLTEALVDEKYKFTDERLSALADSLAIRMTKENAEMLNNLLIKHYHK